MDRRYEAYQDLGRRTGRKIPDIATFNQHVVPDERQRWKVVVIDEFSDLTGELVETKNTIEAYIKRLAQKARAAGIHCILATQKPPSAKVISTTIRSNLGAQLALQVNTGTDSRIILDEMGAESLEGKGDAFLNAGKDSHVFNAVL